MASGVSSEKRNKVSRAASSSRSIHSGASAVFHHKSFKRSYREDYIRELNVPGMMYHILYAFKLIFKNYKLFLPLLLIMVVAVILFVGLMSESTYQEIQKVIDQTAENTGANIGTMAKAGLLLISTVFTGGLSTGSNMGNEIFVALIFLIIWLITIYLLRQLLAGNKVKLRDGLYNAMTPLLSSFVVLVVAVIQAIPVMILIVAYSAAIETNFLSTPFYTILFLVFAALMILLTGYLWSGSLMALTAVTAPGLYPYEGIKAANELMVGRRIKFILRLIALGITMAITWAIVMIPAIMFDLFMKQFTWTAQIPFVPICLVIMTCFSGVYCATYLYIYYRWMIGDVIE